VKQVRALAALSVVAGVAACGGGSAGDDDRPVANDDSEKILGYDLVPTFELTIPPEGIESLRAAPRTYVQGTVTFEGKSYGPVGVRLKGVTAFEPIDAKPAFRVNFETYGDVPFFGLKDLTLNNLHADPSMMHERLAYALARKLGVPASRANHALVILNGQPLGLYANVETVKKEFLRQWFDDPNGSLFEATDVDFVDQYIPLYELETGPDDRTLLSGLAGALATMSGDEAMASADAYANLGEFRRFWAMGSVLGQFDSFPYSVPGDDYFAYADPVSQRLWFVPWGMDETFFAPDFDVTQVNSVLAVRCKWAASCFQDYVDETWKVLAEVEQFDWLAEANRIAAQIAPLIVMDTRKPYSDADVATAQEGVRSFINARRATLGTMLPPPR
jgi:hypothetical protein